MTEFLLTPDVAYLFIVAGLLLVVLALLTPGSGFIELGAVFTLAVAGWQIYNLTINAWALFVLLGGMVLFVLAIRRSRVRMVFLGVSIASLVLGSAYLFRGEGLLPAVNLWLALVVSAGSAGFLWLVATKAVEVHMMRPKHDLGKLVGASGVARTDVHTEGSVYVNMEEWSAQSEEPIPAGSQVQVVGREGLVLLVQIVGDSHSPQ